MKTKITRETLRIPIIIAAIFIALGLVLSIKRANYFNLLNFGYIGISVAIGIFLNRILDKENKQWGRRITQLLVGIYMLIFIGFMLHQNVQIEGFFYLFLTGLVGASVIHYLVAKVFGPVVFGRAWCGWACWTAMLLDFLPWKVPEEPRQKNLGLLRYVHFIVSLALVLIVYLLIKGKIADAYWLLLGNAFYYAAGILLALYFKDNRAFCKYLCPIPAVQKIFSRFSLIKIKIDNLLCNDCGICEKKCPMNVKLLDYKKKNQRILSTECIFCNNCVDSCPQGAARASLGFDAGVNEYINLK
jgi:ferredoxin